jgi:hypothetical protein
MKNLSYFLVVALISACSLGPASRELERQKDSLLLVSMEKDREMNNLLGALLEIDDNIQQIKEKEKIITLTVSKGDDLSAPLKDQINNDIKHIYELMLENKKRISELESQLKISGQNTDMLEKLVSGLNKQLEEKTLEILQLKESLIQKDIEIADLNFTIQGLSVALDSIHAQSLATDRKLSEATQLLNQAYYVFGTKKELKAQKIISRDGLFSQQKILEGEFDEDYFTRIDVREVDSIPLFRKRAKLLTNHPEDSYVLETNSEDALVLKITDKDTFWSISNYLVVQVD